MTDLAVHDGPIFAFTMTDLAVHDGPIFAFTMVRNSQPGKEETLWKSISMASSDGPFPSCPTMIPRPTGTDGRERGLKRAAEPHPS